MSVACASDERWRWDFSCAGKELVDTFAGYVVEWRRSRQRNEMREIPYVIAARYDLPSLTLYLNPHVNFINLTHIILARQSSSRPSKSLNPLLNSILPTPKHSSNWDDEWCLAYCSVDFHWHPTDWFWTILQSCETTGKPWDVHQLGA